MNIDSLADDILSDIDKRKNKSKKEPKPRTKFVMPGPGRKHCPKCDSYMGVRTHVCDCGYKFEKNVTKRREEQVEEPAVTEEEILYARAIGAPGGRIIYVGSGSPSAKLDEITSSKVNDYCNLVINEGFSDGLIYTINAIKHYIQHQLGYNSDEYRKACKFVDQWYEDKISGTT